MQAAVAVGKDGRVALPASFSGLTPSTAALGKALGGRGVYATARIAQSGFPLRGVLEDDGPRSRCGDGCEISGDNNGVSVRFPYSPYVRNREVSVLQQLDSGEASTGSLMRQSIPRVHHSFTVACALSCIHGVHVSLTGKSYPISWYCTHNSAPGECAVGNLVVLFLRGIRNCHEYHDLSAHLPLGRSYSYKTQGLSTHN